MAIDRQQPERHGRAAVRYRSLHCHIGTHGECDETEPADPPLAVVEVSSVTVMRGDVINIGGQPFKIVT